MLSPEEKTEGFSGRTEANIGSGGKSEAMSNESINSSKNRAAKAHGPSDQGRGGLRSNAWEGDEERILIGSAAPIELGGRGGLSNVRAAAGAWQGECIVIGPAAPIRFHRGAGISNTNQQPKPRETEAELLLQLVKAISLLYPDKLGTNGESGTKTNAKQPLANVGYDPNESRIPAGQPAGGQWTSSGAGTGAVAPQGVRGPGQVSRLIAPKPSPTLVPAAQKGRVINLPAKPSPSTPVPIAKGGRDINLPAKPSPATPVPVAKGGQVIPLAATAQKQSAGDDDDGNAKTVGQAAKETAEAFLSGLIGALRSILFPSEPDPESSKPKNILQLAKELNEVADNIDMTKPKGLGHAMAAGTLTAAGEAIAKGTDINTEPLEPKGLIKGGQPGKANIADAAEGALPDAGGLGAAEGLRYEPNPKHPPAGTVAPGESNIAPQPTNPQQALNTSVPFNPNSTGRVAADPETGEFVVFKQHGPGQFHGYSVTWDQLTQPQKNALIKTGQVNVGGKIR